MIDNWDFNESDGRFNIMEGGGGGGPIMWREWSFGEWIILISLMLFIASFFAGVGWLLYSLH